MITAAVGGWFSRLKQSIFGSQTQSHYEAEAERAEDFFQNGEDPVPFAEPAEGEELTTFQTNLELVEFGPGESEDIEWMTFNHDTGEVMIQFLEHGLRTKHAHLYSYADIPYEEFQALAAGDGPFPSGRWPHYLKPRSVGQRANYYIRNDHADNLYEYKREG